MRQSYSPEELRHMVRIQLYVLLTCLVDDYCLCFYKYRHFTANRYKARLIFYHVGSALCFPHPGNAHEKSPGSRRGRFLVYVIKNQSLCS